MLDYIIQVLLFQTLFLAVYDLLLKKETFFQWNRAYLIITSIVAYCIPFIKIDKVQFIVPQEYIVQLPEIMLSPTAVIKDTFDWSVLLFNLMPWVFWIGMILMTGLFIIKLSNLIGLIYKNEKFSENKYQLVFLDSNKAFSFFKYIFLGKALSEENKQQIIAHELVHVGQKHTIDLLFFEVQKMICWFNPFSYLFQHRIAELHEFIADAKTVKDTNKKDYFQHLLSQTFGTHKISFINSFLKISLIKKRIIMLNKNKSKQILRLKYLLLVPILLSMLLYSSCEKNEELLEKDRSTEEFINKLKSEKGELTDKEIEELKERIDVLINSLNKDDLSEREREIKDYLYLYLLKKRKEILAGSYEKKDEQIERNRNFDDSEGVPFAVITKPPMFPGCEDAEDPKGCFNLNMQKYVAQNFNISLSKDLGLEQGRKKIYVQFKIDKNGEIADVKARAPHEALEEEAKRIMQNVPKMRAGEKENGEKVAVTYMLPITLNIQ